MRIVIYIISMRSLSKIIVSIPIIIIEINEENKIRVE